MAVMPQYGQLANIMGQKQQTIPDKAKQPQGTGFTNLQKILGANQGNHLGEAVVGGVKQFGNQAQQGLQKQQAAFGTDIQSSRDKLANEQGMVQNTFNKIDQPNYQQGGVTEGDAQGFQSLKNEQYGGPQGLQNADMLQKQAQQSAQYGNLAKSREGRQELLRSMVGGTNYTPTQQRMDELFLAQSQPDLMNAAKQGRQVLGQVQKGVNVAQGQAQTQKNAIEALKQQAASGIESRTGGINTAINDQLSTARTNEGTRLANMNSYREAINRGDYMAADKLAGENKLIDEQTMKDTDYLSKLLGPNINSVLASSIQNGSTPLTRGYASTDVQRSQLGALAQLAGGKSEFEGYTPEQAQAASLKLGDNFGDSAKQAANSLVYSPERINNSALGAWDSVLHSQQTALNNPNTTLMNNILNYQTGPWTGGDAQHQASDAYQQSQSGDIYNTADALAQNNPYTGLQKMPESGIIGPMWQSAGFLAEQEARKNLSQRLAQKYMQDRGLKLQ